LVIGIYLGFGAWDLVLEEIIGIRVHPCRSKICQEKEEFKWLRS